jgi:hypothetical protein
MSTWRTPVGMTGADIAQNDLGLTGAGVKVGVIDAGIDYDHPDFGGNGTPGDGINPDPNFGPSGNSRVKFGYDFVGDDYNAASTNPALPGPDSGRQPRLLPQLQRRLRLARHARGRHRRRQRHAALRRTRRRARRHLRRLPRVRLLRLDRQRHHARRDGARARRRHERRQHVDRLDLPVAAVPDRGRRDPPGEPGRDRGRLDR